VSHLRIATYNVRHCRGIDGRVDVRRTAQVLNRCAAEVIALQEVDRNVRRSGVTDQPGELARLSGLHVSFWPTLGYQGGDFGIAVATQDAVETEFRLLDNEGMRGRRHGAITVCVEGLTVVATHLSRKPRARAAETAHVRAIAAEARPPAVVTGDLNQGRRDLDRLLDAGFVRDARRPTFPSFLPMRQVDYVLAGPGARIERSRTIRTLASDHLPLVAKVVFDR
jgi:endonuclease/exonuclease/phosphatase family metal-dependent hydrolase